VEHEPVFTHQSVAQSGHIGPEVDGFVRKDRPCMASRRLLPVMPGLGDGFAYKDEFPCKDGLRLVETAPAARIFAAPAHPYTAALLAAAPVPDPEAARQRKLKSRRSSR
jgi:hypothetical protein